MLDVAFRTHSTSLTVQYVHWLFKNDGSYRYIFSNAETSLLRFFQIFGRHGPSISIPIMLQQTQNMTKEVVFFEGESSFIKHAQKKHSEGSTLDINLIGEALIDEHEAKLRIAHYKKLLAQDEIHYVSVKTSTLFSQIKALAFDENIAELKLDWSKGQI